MREWTELITTWWKESRCLFTHRGNEQNQSPRGERKQIRPFKPNGNKLNQSPGEERGVSPFIPGGIELNQPTRDERRDIRPLTPKEWTEQVTTWRRETYSPTQMKYDRETGSPIYTQREWTDPTTTRRTETFLHLYPCGITGPVTMCWAERSSLIKARWNELNQLPRLEVRPVRQFKLWKNEIIQQPREKRRSAPPCKTRGNELIQSLCEEGRLFRPETITTWWAERSVVLILMPFGLHFSENLKMQFCNINSW